MGINWWDEWNIGDDTIGQRYGSTVQRYNLMNKRLEELKNEFENLLAMEEEENKTKGKESK